jgi:8-oxo-dGTP pyrophosphatase MutT (NUDIX family)
MQTELLDVFDEHGRWLGVKDRELVHSDGDWHRCFHYWIVSCRPTPHLIVQRRALEMRDFPGMLDVSVSGHLLAGEKLDDAIRRELHEELGLSAGPVNAAPYMRYVVDLSDRGRLFREFIDVLVLRDDRPIAAYAPGPEVDALIAVPTFSAMELWAGRINEIESLEHDPDSGDDRPIRVRREDFVGPQEAPYFTSILQRAADLCSPEPVGEGLKE